MSEQSPSQESIVQYPLLPLRDVVVFPHMVIPLFVGRPKSIKAMETAMEAGKSILLVAQKSAAKDDPGPGDMYAIGCVSNILQMLKLPDGTVKVLVEGGARAQIREVVDVKSHWIAEAVAVPLDGTPAPEVEAMRRALLSAFDQYVKLNKKIPPEILTSMSGIDDGGRLADAIAAHLPLKLEQKQQILEMNEAGKRLEHLLGVLEGEVDILQVEKRIRGRVKRQMEKSQREYYLNEQVKAIQKELGEGEEGADLEEMEKKIRRAHMHKDARKKAESELKKLKLMSPMSAEATVVRNYIETLVNLPWKKKSKISKDISMAQEILDKDHYGLEKVKERIVEYLAVQTRVDKMKAPILCLVGAPGVGKTSLGQSIARATNRKFVRMSLGGVRDEAEIRGHRRTYIGSMPGKILQNMSKVGVKNGELSVSEAAIRDIVRYYTREAGVRALERELSKICRKAVKQLLTEKQAGDEKAHRITATPKNLDKFLGVRKFSFGMAEKQNQVGQVTGLAWTEVGGELLTIEAVTMPGKGKTITTGKLGEVMQESIHAALSVVRARSRKLGVKEDFYQKNDIHIHLPEGATPKDGPSAGIGIATSMVSILSGIPVRADVAMTGEITLRGEVLQIGGLKEKLLPAHRGGIKTVLIPQENVKDLVEIPDNIKNKLEIVPVKWIDKVLEIALERSPEPLSEADDSAPIPAKPDDQPGAATTH